MFADVAANGGDQGRHTAKGSAAQALAGDLGEEAFDEIQPRRPGRREVKMKPRVLREPRLDRRMFMSAIVIENEMDVAPTRGLPINGVQEHNELGVGVARLTALDHMPFEDIQRGKERGGAVPLVIMRLPR